MSSQEEFLIYFVIALVIVTFWHWFEKKICPNMQRYVPPQQATLPSNPQPSPAATYHHVINTLPTGRQNGLDRDVLRSLPIYTYATSASPDPLIECSVCLSVFKDKETYRELPTCKHRFHAECIDLWFYSHSNCPLCRANVEGPVQPTVGPIQPTVGPVQPTDRPVQPIVREVLVEPTRSRETHIFFA